MIAIGAARKLERDANDVFGTSHAFDLAGVHPPSISPSIDWNNFNYPRGLNLIHYDLDELPSESVKVIRPIHWGFILSCSTLLLNLFNTVVLTFGGVSALRLCFSFLNILIFGPAFGYAFYQGYRGIAVSSSSYTTRFLFCQGCLLVLVLFFSLVPMGAINGIARLSHLRAPASSLGISGGIKSYWIYVTVTESLLWLIALLIGVRNFYRVWTFNPYESSEDHTGNVFF
ncbi:hypothetical protein IE077_000800 [Cardiosporidium cionae]|uniref:Secretory carrier membrane protein n=1 Tax=Cardiosporidium cionae TaxID=476202 RepID=A0ABQ7J6E7_9APIC|nr:hypothetical protein IE077_000800 [Cardiosporidium cionae]|eukprot:KAF8819581.1 hypothetical protein IE077_000800 [Cardiosporidium cionae]